MDLSSLRLLTSQPIHVIGPAKLADFHTNVLHKYGGLSRLGEDLLLPIPCDITHKRRVCRGEAWFAPVDLATVWFILQRDARPISDTCFQLRLPISPPNCGEGLEPSSSPANETGFLLLALDPCSPRSCGQARESNSASGSYDTSLHYVSPYRIDFIRFTTAGVSCEIHAFSQLVSSHSLYEISLSLRWTAFLPGLTTAFSPTVKSVT